MNEERILDKLDALDRTTTTILVEVARVQEQVKDVPDLKTRVSNLEKWKYTAMGALATSGLSIASQVYTALKGA